MPTQDQIQTTSRLAAVESGDIKALAHRNHRRAMG